ncbi:MAG TPA: hypothetical protein VEB86_17170, partial [Chryseosolibacter sp.]|nr:hypothetical protein [Chryseosolibacter sp.]
MKQTSLLFAVLLPPLALFAQKQKLEGVSDHYKTLQESSAAPAPARAWMDTIQYPPSEYGSSIVYLLAKPHYLSEAQVEELTKSVSFPANSSERVRQELDYLLELQRTRTAQQITRVEFLGNIGYWPSINLIPSHLSYEQNLKDLFFEGREVLGENINSKNFPK